MASHRGGQGRVSIGRVLASLAAVVAMVAAMAVSGSAAYAEGDTSGGTPVVGVTKTLVNPGPFNPGDPFTYTIQYTCSSLETACPDATLTDVIPPQVGFVSNTTTSTPSTITYDAATSTLKVAFTSVVDASGTLGLVAGTTGQLSVTVKFPTGTADGTTAHNCAVIAATGAAQAQSCVDAEALTTPAYGVSLSKSYTSPFTGNTASSGVQGTGPTSTLDLSATLDGNQPATSVTVVDPGPAATNPFDSFNLTGFPTLSLPTGVQADIQTRTTGGYTSITGSPFTTGQTPAAPGNAAAVTGVQVVYTATAAGGAIAAGTTLDVKAGVQLRDTLRSDPSAKVPAQTVPNQALATAAYKAAPAKTATATAQYTVVGQSTTVKASKTISPASAQERSGAAVTMTAGGRNAGNVPATGMTVVDGGPGGAAWAATFAFTGFDALSLPSGVTAEVDVYNSAASKWVVLGASYGNGATPKLSDASPAVTAGNVTGVRWVYTGTILAGATVSNSFTATLNDSAAVGAIASANCASVSMTTADGTGASTDNACADFTVTPITTSITAGKSFNPNAGTAGTGPKTTVTLSGSNTSNVALSAFQLVDPGTGSDATFDSFNFTGFGKITAPAGTTWTVEVDTGGSTWIALSGTYSSGQTPALPGEVAAGQVQGVRYTLASGAIPADTDAIRTTIDMQLRNQNRSTGTPINSGSVKNCDTATAGALTASACATFTITATNPGTGTGASKSISPSTVVQGTGITSTVTLRAANNDANVPATSVTVEDSPTSSTSTPAFWSAVGFAGFTGTIGMPTGTTNVKVQYHTSSGWTTIGTYTAAPQAATLNTGLTYMGIDGVSFTWTGAFPAGTTGFTAAFQVSLNGSTTAAGYNNCATQTFNGPLYKAAVSSPLCKTLTVQSRSYTIDQSKSFDPATGTVGLDPAATSTAWLNAKNTGNLPIDSLVVTEPSTTNQSGGTLANPLGNSFALTGFDLSNLSGGIKASITVEDSTGTSHNLGTYTKGQTVSFGSVVPADVRSVVVTYTAGSGQIPAAQKSSMTVGLNLQLLLTQAPTAGTVIANCFDSVALVGTTTEATGHACATFTAQAQSPGVSATKSWNPASGIRDQLPASTVTIGGRNSGNIPVQRLVLQDPQYTTAAPPTVSATAFDAFDVTGLTGLAFPQGADRVQVDVLTADGTWHDGTPAASLPAGSTVNGVALGDIVGVRATFSNSTGALLPVVTDTAKTGSVGIAVVLRDALRSTGAPIAVPPSGSATIDNQSSALVVSGGTPGTPAAADAKYTITGGAVQVTPSKTLYPDGSPTTVNPDQTLIYQLQIKNTGTRNLVAPVVVDKYNAAQLGYDPSQPYPGGGYRFVANGSTLTGTGLAVDSATAGQVRFTFAPGDYLAPGQTAYLRVVMTTKPGLPAGTQIANTYGVTWDTTGNGPVACTTGSSGTFDGAATWCTASQTVKVQTADGMASVKWIKGENGLGFSNVADPASTVCPTSGTAPDLYTHYPCIAHTVVNGVFDYNLDMTVSGNVPMDAARAIDVLPHVGDTGVLLTGQSRGSAWTPTFLGPVAVTGLPVGATYTLYYSDSYTPSTAPLTSPTAGTWAGWSTTGFGAATKAIGIDVTAAAGTPLPPASTVQLHWQMTAPPVSPGSGSITWNSFAFTGHPTDGSGWLLAAEPRKVGIDLANPTVTVSKTTIGGDGTFQFTLTQIDPTTQQPLLGKDGKPVFESAQQVQTSHTGTGPQGHGAATWAPPSDNLQPGGTYRLDEAPSSSWDAAFVGCVNNAVTVDGKPQPVDATPGADGSVYFAAPANAAIDCSFQNTFIPPPPPPPTTPSTVTPQVGQAQCILVGSGETVNVSPIAVAGISYTVVGNGTSSVVVTATAQPGFTLVVPAGWTAAGANAASILLTPALLLCVGGESSETTPPPTTTPPAVTPPTRAAPTSGNNVSVLGTSSSAKPGQMAYTGVDAYGMGLLALLLLAGGAAALALASIRRRSPRRH